MIIGITGYATAGKDTVANILRDKFGYKIMAFADKLRQMALAINPYICIEQPGVYGTEMSDGTYMRYSEVLDKYGYTEAKKFKDFRGFLQRLGTDAVRNVFGQNAWVDALMSSIDNAWTSAKIVIPDIRFQNEAAAVKDRQGLLIRIIRPNCIRKSEHMSEMEQESITVDFTVNNDGTIPELEEKLAKLMMEKNMLQDTTSCLGCGTSHTSKVKEVHYDTYKAIIKVRNVYRCPRCQHHWVTELKPKGYSLTQEEADNF